MSDAGSGPGSASRSSRAIPTLAAWGRLLDACVGRGPEPDAPHHDDELLAVWAGLDPAAQVIIGATLRFERDVQQHAPAVEELAAMVDLVADALAGSLVGVSGEPSLSVRDDPVMEAWLADALVEDLTAVSDAYEALICDGRMLVVADGDFGRSSIVMMNRRGLDWSVAVWPSQHDRTYVPPGAPGGLAGDRAPRVPTLPFGHGSQSIDPEG